MLEYRAAVLSLSPLVYYGMDTDNSLEEDLSGNFHTGQLLLELPESGPGENNRTLRSIYFQFRCVE